MKQGDLVRFINQGHNYYFKLRLAAGLVTDIDYSVCEGKPFNIRHKGPRVVAVFGGKPIVCFGNSLEVINESR